ncbi:MAG: YigZ family protein [Succinivibrionaceae bacterium]|nr:YigZ family protein [Succinivibrionaceae bacterium]
MSGNEHRIPDLSGGKIFRNEITVKKSRFIASAGHTAGVPASDAFIERIRQEFRDARHNCYAFNACKGNETAFTGCSDDGEPKGTAGRPMLNVLIHSGIGEITVVVTRYFGGILLGTGGLVRAYQDSIKELLAGLPVKAPENTVEFECTVHLSEMHIAGELARKYKGRIVSRNFSAESCIFRISADAGIADELKRELARLCTG